MRLATAFGCCDAMRDPTSVPYECATMCAASWPSADRKPVAADARASTVGMSFVRRMLMCLYSGAMIMRPGGEWRG